MTMCKILVFLFLPILLHANELEFKSIYFLDSNLEVSGITLDKEKLLFVSDNKEDQYLYQLTRKDSKTYLTKAVTKINDFKGFQEYYYSTILSLKGGRWLKSPWDLEGISKCEDQFYLVNEQAREVVVLNDSKKELSTLDINFNPAFKELGVKLEDIPTNAGFEGIAIDCNNKTLYIAQERNPRGIFIYDLKTLQYRGLIKTAPQKSTQISPDYSDIFFYNNFLYVLEKNEWKILKVDPKTKEKVDEYSFEKNPMINLRKLYKTDEPYGLAEALYITEDEIIIGIDNNKKPLSKRAEILFNVKGNSSSVIYFKTPKNL